MTKRTLCISYINWAARADTIYTASSEIESLPVTNLRDRDTSQVWGVSGLSVDNTDFYADVELVENLPIGTVALVLGWRYDRPSKALDTPMMAPTDKIQITIDEKAGSFGAGVLADSGLIDCNIDSHLAYHVFHTPAPVVGAKIRVAIDAISRADEGFWWGARLWVGPRKDFLRGHQYNHIEKFENNEFDEPRRIPTFPIQRLKLEEMPDMHEFEQLTNTEEDFLFTYDKADPHRTSIIGRRLTTTGFQGAFYRNYGFNLQISEQW